MQFELCQIHTLSSLSQQNKTFDSVDQILLKLRLWPRFEKDLARHIILQFLICIPYIEKVNWSKI